MPTTIVCDRLDCIYNKLYNKRYPILPPYEHRCFADAIGISEEGCDTYMYLPTDHERRGDG